MLSPTFEVSKINQRLRWNPSGHVFFDKFARLVLWGCGPDGRFGGVKSRSAQCPNRQNESYSTIA